MFKNDVRVVLLRMKLLRIIYLAVILQPIKMNP